MKGVLFAAAALVIGFALPATRWSKGQTVKIVVRGDHLASPIEIADPSSVERNWFCSSSAWEKLVRPLIEKR